MTAWFSGFQWGSLANASPAGSLLFKVTVLLAAALAVDFLLHRRFTLGCAAMWNGVLLALAILPVAWLALPAVRLAQSGELADGSHLPVASVAAMPRATVETAPSDHAASFLPQDEEVAPATAGISEARLPWVAIPFLYLIGCGISLLRLTGGLLAVRRLRRSSEITNAAWTARLDHWRTECGIAQTVTLKESSTAGVPLVVGHWRPAIILPAQMAAAADDKTRDSILVHELAHVARRDYAWQLFQRMLGAALWFHPLFWVAERRLRFVRERVCDDFAVHRLGSAGDYIDTLLAMATRLTRSPAVSLGMAVLRSSHLGERLAAIHGSRGSASFRAGRSLRLGLLSLAVLAGGWFGRSAIAEQEVPRIEGLTADAETLLDEFDAEAQRLRDEAERKIAAKRAELEQQLRALQTRYTRDDKLDEAVAIRDQIRLLRAATIAEGTPLTVLDDPGNMSQYAQSVGKSYYVKVVGSNAGWMWGTDEYTHDSSVAAAAVHSGVLQIGETGVVKVTMLPGRTAYIGMQRNGLTSHDWQNGSGGYVSFKVERAPPEIAALAKVGSQVPVRWIPSRIAQPKMTAEATRIVEIMPYTGTVDGLGLSSLRPYQGQTFHIQVTGSADPNAFVWGSDIYTDDSSLAAAAVHAGALRGGETGIVRVTILPGRASYEGSDRNGITSRPWGTFGGSFSVAPISRPGPRDR